MSGAREKSRYGMGSGAGNIARDVSSGSEDALRDSTLTFGHTGQKTLPFRVIRIMPVAATTGVAAAEPPLLSSSPLKIVGWTPSSVRFQLEIARTRASKLRFSTGTKTTCECPTRDEFNRHASARTSNSGTRAARAAWDDRPVGCECRGPSRGGALPTRLLHRSPSTLRD